MRVDNGVNDVVLVVRSTVLGCNNAVGVVLIFLPLYILRASNDADLSSELTIIDILLFDTGLATSDTVTTTVVEDLYCIIVYDGCKLVVLANLVSTDINFGDTDCDNVDDEYLFNDVDVSILFC